MAIKLKDIPVLVDVPLQETSAAIQIIQKFKKKNKIDFELFVAYDFSLEEMGVYYLGKDRKKSYSKEEKDLRNIIFTNPITCKGRDETTPTEVFFPGYCSDYTLFGVTVHEFCHYLQIMQYPTILDDYTKEFPTERFYINDYCNNELRDEVAELMTLYLVNPFLLKLISYKHWKFFRKFFKSSVSCSTARSFIIYECFPIHVKNELNDKWGICYNHKLGEFVKNDRRINDNQDIRNK